MDIFYSWAGWFESPCNKDCLWPEPHYEKICIWRLSNKLACSATKESKNIAISDVVTFDVILARQQKTKGAEQTVLRCMLICALLIAYDINRFSHGVDQSWHIWASSWDYGTYRTGQQRRLKRDCAITLSRARAFAVGTHEVWKQTKGLTKNQTYSPAGWLRMCVWRKSLLSAISAIISWVGSF